MRTYLSWSDKVQDRDGVRQSIWDVAFHPNGTHMLVAAGSEILIYDVNEGELLNSLKSHKDLVYALDYSADGQRFASGSADKNVILWNDKMEGILKYQHHDSIQCLAFNPINSHLVSCTASDFGIWSQEQKSVSKFKVTSRILCVSWTRDGQHFALGHYNGSVSIRSKNGDEKLKIERGDAPVWSICWNPNPQKDEDVLAVTDWSQRLSFFNLNGKQVGKDRSVGFDPCTVSYFTGGDYLVVGGSDKKVSLWTTEGIRIGTICEKEHWIWCAKLKANQPFVAVGSQDGTVSVHQIAFNTVHGLYQDRYAYRENMTDVVIQHLSTDQRARIKCRDHVKKISVYKDRLAVQLTDRVIIYELFHDDATDMHYRIKEKIQKKLECNLLVVTALHIVLCLEGKLQMYNFAGEKEREWSLDSLIRYIKVMGGPIGKECLLVGLKNGHILQIFIDNPFPISLIRHTASIRCLDVSMNRSKLAIVDEQNTLLVYDLSTKELLYQEPQANSVSWNTEYEDMLCYSSNGQLYVKAGQFPAYQQSMQGFVVGFKSSRVFCLHQSVMSTMDVSHSQTLEKYLEKSNYTEAYKLACLGVTETDWRRLAMTTLEAMEFDIAKKSFIRLRDLKYIDLIRQFERQQAEHGQHDSDATLADIYATSGKYMEAAKLYRKSGHHQKAIDMFTDLNMWEEATHLAEETDGDRTGILKKKAKMQLDRNELLPAAMTLVDIGEYMQAIEIMGSNGWLDPMMQVARKLNKTETKALARCVLYFKNQNHHAFAAECLVKMGDIPNLLNLHIELQHWEEAFKLVENYPAFASQIYLPYANWLAMNDRFVEAQLNYRKAGRLDQAYRVLLQLCQNSISEKRYEDASYYFWMLSMQHLDSLPANVPADKLDKLDRKNLNKFKQYHELSEVYFAYHHVQRYMDEPFTSHLPESLFNMSRFILNYLNRRPIPQGISKVYALYAFAKLARSLGAFKAARHAYEKLQHCIIPDDWIDGVELGSLTIRSKPMMDRPELHHVCYACGTLNPLITHEKNENECCHCSEPFVQSFYSFDTLPLVQFVLEPGMTHEQAMKYLETPAPSHSIKKNKQGGAVGGMAGMEANMESSEDDPFSRSVMELNRGASTQKYSPIVVTKKQLLFMDKQTVFVRRWGKKCIPDQYFKQVDHGHDQSPLSLRACSSCQHMFLEDEWCFQILQKGACPFCRTPHDDFE